MSSPCCVAGFVDSGIPTGSEQLVAGISCYVAAPETATTKAIVIATDVFGFKLPNVRLIADGYARRGFYCIVPNLLVNEPPMDLLDRKEGSEKPTTISTLNSLGFKGVGKMLYFLMTNSRKTGIDKSMLIINTLKAEMGYKFVGVQGYCWGGTTAVKLAQALDTAHAFVAAHPGDIKLIKKPIYFVLSEHDFEIHEKQIGIIKSEMEELQKIEGLETSLIRVFSGTEHGFAVRGDESNEQVRKCRQEAFDTSVDFFNSNIQ